MTAIPFTAVSALGNPFRRLFADEPLFTGLALIMAMLTVPTLAALALDPRLFQGESIWIKPLKFQIALALYLATLAVFARWLPAGMTARRGYRIYAGIVATAIVLEILWIGGAAALGTASHFNTATPVAQTIYAVMGAAAVTLTSASLVYGIAVWRNPATGLTPPMQTALALGLILTFALTVPIAGTMSSLPGHFIGTPVTHAALPVMGWSMEVGDLRAPHFFATHAMHLVPLAALVLARTTRTAWLMAAAFAAFTLAIFAQALMGLPLIPA